MIIVDNSSSIRDEYVYSFPIQIIKPDKNIGFGRANNLGVSSALGKFVLFLNPDCKLMADNDLQNMVSFIDENVEVGLLAPAILEKGNIIQPVYNYPKQRYLGRNYFQSLPGRIAWVLGAVMLVRKNNFVNQLGGFDKDFFLYAEETDLCLRYRMNGFSIAYLDNILVQHIGGASEVSSTSYDQCLRKQRGLYLFLYKHYPIYVFNRIISSEKISSIIKLLLARLKIAMGDRSAKAYNDYNRYKAIYDSAKKTLNNINWLYFKD